ncbi:streptophobe family protein [Streptomyces sp. NPDC002889]|uniref:streptophobe family protein n=1 Tax=Streptomyces sp. NPDC002889 TaxID=3364669 RepID=UPI0036B8B2A1
MGSGSGRGGAVWGDVVLSSVAAVSWCLVGMAGAAAAGLHLLGADRAGALGPMTAAVVVLAAGGSVTPTGDVSAFGPDDAEVHSAIDLTPVGVGLVGALLLAYLFLRSLRGTRAYISLSELCVRTAGVVVLFVTAAGGLAWAGHDVITIDGARLGLDRELPDAGGIGSIGVPGVGGLPPGRWEELAHADTAVGFGVDTPRSLVGALLWVLGVLAIAYLASSRTPLPRGAGWDAVHSRVRPAVSALVSAALVAVLAGYAAAAYAAVGTGHPGGPPAGSRESIAGAALLGAPNGAWLGVVLGLFVPWDGAATGALAQLLPDPLNEALTASDGRPVTVGSLAALDGRVWLLTAGAAALMLYAGVLTAARTPAERGRRTGAAAFTVRCALRLGAATAVALPLLVRLTDVFVDASVSVLGIDAFDASIELHGDPRMACALGGAWGAGAGAAGALLVHGIRGAPRPVPAVTEGPGPYCPAAPYRPPNAATNPYLRLPPGIHEAPTPPPAPDPPPDGPRDFWPGPDTRGRDG